MPLRESPERGSATHLELFNSKSNVCAVAIDLLNPHGCSMTSPGIDDHDVDEALWVAYRCYDKSAVAENLLRRYLPELTFIPNVSADRDVVRKSGGNEVLGHDRSRCACKHFNGTGHTRWKSRGGRRRRTKHFHATGRRLGMALVDEMMFS